MTAIAYKRELVSVAKLKPPPANRAIRDDDVDELAATIAEYGLQTDPIVRRKGRGGFEIVAGEKRRRALVKLGTEKVWCRVYELTDEQAQDHQFVENLQRSDPHPMEQAEMFERQLERRTPEQIAAHIGKSVSYVHARLRLLGLCPAGRKAFLAGRLTLTAAAALARASKADQTAVLKRWSDLDRDPHAVYPTHELMRDLAEQLISLKTAGFALDVVVDGVDAPACNECPKRTGNQTALFADAFAKDDRCTDPKCFKLKSSAHWKEAKKEHEARGGKVQPKLETRARNAWWGDSLAAAEYVDLQTDAWIDGKKVIWRDAIKKSLGEVPAEEVILTKDELGGVHEVVPRKLADKVERSLRAERKESDPWAKREKARLKKERHARKVNKRARELLLEALPEAVRDLNTTQALATIVELKRPGAVYGVPEVLKADVDECRKADLEQATPAQLTRWSVAMLLGTALQHEHSNGGATIREETREALSRLGLDVAEFERQAKAELKPKPKRQPAAKKTRKRKAAK